MKVTITKASDFRYQIEREISGMEELTDTIAELWTNNRTSRGITGGVPAAVVYDRRKDKSNMDVEVLLYDEYIEG